MDKYIEKLANNHYITVILERIYALSPDEVKLLVIITAVLIILLVFKRFGIRMAMALGMVYLIIYVLYINNFLSVYSNSQEVKEQHMEELQIELNK